MDGSLKEKIYETLVEDICSMKLTPDMIFTENSLVERFGVSKAPVREALVQLCHEQVLRSMPRCGYQVVQISPRRVHELVELRLLLEVGSLPAVLARMTPKAGQMLDTLIDKRSTNQEGRDVWTAWKNNLEFHLKVNEIADNELVNDTLQRAMNACRRAYAQGYKGQRSFQRIERGAHAHDQIVQALKDGDLETARQRLTEDIMEMETLLLTSKG